MHKIIHIIHIILIVVVVILSVILIFINITNITNTNITTSSLLKVPAIILYGVSFFWYPGVVGVFPFHLELGGEGKSIRDGIRKSRQHHIPHHRLSDAECYSALDDSLLHTLTHRNTTRWALTLDYQPHACDAPPSPESANDLAICKLTPTVSESTRIAHSIPHLPSISKIVLKTSSLGHKLCNAEIPAAMGLRRTCKRPRTHS